MDGPIRDKALGFEAADGFEVLQADGLHVLRAPGEDFAVGGCGCGEGRVEPLVGFGGDDVGVGVEEEGREGGGAAGPGEEDERFVGGEFDCLGVEADGGGLVEKKEGGSGVVWGWVGSVDAKVLLEAGDD